MISFKSVKGLAALTVVALSATLVLSGPVKADTPALVIYDAIGYDQDIAKAFTAATGIKVNIVTDSTGPLLAKAAAEQNNPQWDLFWADGDTWAAAMDLQGKLLPYAPKAHFTNVGAQLTPKNHSYNISGVTAMVGAVYNADKIKNIPANFAAMLKPEFKGLIGMNDPSISGPTYPFVAGLMNQLGGEDAGKAFLSKMKDNGLVINDKNGPTLHALEIGQIQIGLVQSSAAMNEVAKFTAKPVAGFTPKIFYPARTTLLPSSIAIDKNRPAASQAAAKKFIDFLFSPAGQAIATQTANSDSFFWSVIRGTTLNPAVTPFPTRYQIIDPYKWGPLQGEIDTWFTSSIRGK